MKTTLQRLYELGQAPWYDNIRRLYLEDGTLAHLVDQGIVGLTANPTIFEKAIGQNDDYDEAIAGLLREDHDVQAAAVYERLAVEDIQSAADLMRPVHEATGGLDGMVSLEVAPELAHDTGGTIRDARRLWRLVDRPNLFIKVPATAEGIPAISGLIGEGINVNVTLIFGLARYRQVMDAYVEGLEELLRQGRSLKDIKSVASFFVSRVDAKVDPQIDRKIAEAKDESSREALKKLRGKAAIANARLAYRDFREYFSMPRFVMLEGAGARVQRPLWASTSTKDPAYPDTYYVEALIAPDTVDTMPPQTIDAYLDHGRPKPRTTGMGVDRDEAAEQLQQLRDVAGVNMDEVTDQLESEGVASFSKSFASLHEEIAVKLARMRQAEKAAGHATAG